ncbi:hypothetical protein BDY19DRAFT_989659 [Irpex rosettiformis]|uniref:Uncharacterized protein n=1 Tax=Irpex rosettiformis TaxID=378272 RepID=A0ACB8UF36_9APHY|nr:hypothetical protein BDY19DRAFT_989659 [Irpex rosettiformis]
MATANRPQCSRIITASPFVSSASPNPEAAFSSRDTLVHKFEIALRRQGTLHASGKMSQPALHAVGPRDLPQRVAGSSLPRDLEGRDILLGTQSRKISTPSLTASSSSPFTSPNPLTPSQECYSNPYSSPTYTSHRSPVVGPRSRSGSLVSTYTTTPTPTPTPTPYPTPYPISISPSPTVRHGHSAVVLPIGQKLPKWRECTGTSSATTTTSWTLSGTGTAEMDSFSSSLSVHHLHDASMDTGSTSVDSTSSPPLPRIDRRVPLGPRPPPFPPRCNAVGLGFHHAESVPVDAQGQPLDELGAYTCVPTTSVNVRRAYRERRKAYDFGSQGQGSVALSLSLSLSPRSGSGSQEEEREDDSDDEREYQEIEVVPPDEEWAVRVDGDGTAPTTAQIDKAMREVEEELFSYRSSFVYSERSGSASRSASGSESESSQYSSGSVDAEEDDDDDGPAGKNDREGDLHRSQSPLPHPSPIQATSPPPLMRTSIESVNSEALTVPPYPNSPPHYQAQFPYTGFTATAGAVPVGRPVGCENISVIKAAETGTAPLPSPPPPTITTIVAATGPTATPSPISVTTTPPPISITTTTPTPLRTPERHPAHPVSPRSPIALPTLTVLIPGREPFGSPRSLTHPKPPMHSLSTPSTTSRLLPSPAVQLPPSTLERTTSSHSHDDTLASSLYQNADIENGGERSAFDDSSDSDVDSASDRPWKTQAGRMFGGIGKLKRAIVRSSASMESGGQGLNLRKRLSFHGGGIGSNGMEANAKEATVDENENEETTTITAIATTTMVDAGVEMMGEKIPLESLTGSPESVRSLRARQFTSSSGIEMGLGSFSYRNSHVGTHHHHHHHYHQRPPTTEQRTSLSPIPATPLDVMPASLLDEELKGVSERLENVEMREGNRDRERDQEGDESELPTPVTPIVERTKSFIAQLARLPNSPLMITVPPVPPMPKSTTVRDTSLVASLQRPPLPLVTPPAFAPQISPLPPLPPPKTLPFPFPRPRPPLPIPPPSQSFFSQPSVQEKVQMLAMKASAPPDLPLPPVPAVQMKLSAEALERQAREERTEGLDINRWRARVLAEAQVDEGGLRERDSARIEREREEERAKVQAKIRGEEEELAQVLAAEDREKERVRAKEIERKKNKQLRLVENRGDEGKEKLSLKEGGEEYLNRLTVVNPDESMLKLEMSMAKLEAYAPVPVVKEDVAEERKSVKQKESPSVVDAFTKDSGAAKQVKPGKKLLNPPKSARAPPNTPNSDAAYIPPHPHPHPHPQPESARPSKPCIPPKDPGFMRRTKKRQTNSKPPPTAWIPEGQLEASSSSSTGIVLPTFDFEAPDHTVVDWRGMGLRAESRLDFRSSIEGSKEAQTQPVTNKESITSSQPRHNLDEDLLDVPLVPLRRRPSCSPDLRTNDSIASFASDLSANYSAHSSGTATDTHRMSSLKLKETKLRVQKLFGRITERTEAIRERVPQVGFQKSSGQQVKIL